MGRALAAAAAIVISLLVVSGAGGAGAQKPQNGGTVAVSFSLPEPPCLNRWLPACDNGVEWDPLVSQTLQGALEPGPRGWRDVLVSGTTLTKKPFAVTYHIRPQAHWSDGKPVTASDFVFSYRMSLRYSNLSQDDPLRTQIRHFVAIGAKTLRVGYASPFARWRDILPRPLPAHVLAGEDFRDVWKDGIDDPKTGEPIGDGPFLVQRWEKDRQLVLVRNPNYWGQHPAHIARLVFRFVSDPGDALQSGEVDLLGGAQDQGATFELAQQPPPGIKVLSTPGSSWEHFDFRVAPPGPAILRDKVIRRALAYGINRRALVRALYGDLAPNLKPLENTIFLTNEHNYQPNWRIYDYNPTLARRLLRRAGCRVGSDGIYACAGETLSFQFLTNADNSRRAQTLQIVQAQLKRIGIEVVPEYAPGSAFFGPGGILANGTFEVALYAWQKNELGNVYSTYHCGYPGDYSGYCSRLADIDMDQLFEIVDPERQAAVANRVDRRLVQDVPVIPLFQTPLFTAFRKTIHGVVPSAFNDPTWNAENWWVER